MNYIVLEWSVNSLSKVYGIHYFSALNKSIEFVIYRWMNIKCGIALCLLMSIVWGLIFLSLVFKLNARTICFPLTSNEPNCIYNIYSIHKRPTYCGFHIYLISRGNNIFLIQNVGLSWVCLSPFFMFKHEKIFYKCFTLHCIWLW